MTTNDLVDEWIHHAREDRRTAQFLTAMAPVPREIVCFHCEQCAEKALKAVLEASVVDVPRTHDLLLLLRLAHLPVPDVAQLERACNELNDYSVSVRYPRRLEITETDVTDALSAADVVMTAALGAVDRA